jgi:hypothetical protein
MRKHFALGAAVLSLSACADNISTSPRLAAPLSASRTVSAGTLLSDDFSAPTLNTALWSVALPQSNCCGDVYVSGGSVYVVNRGHLNTVSSYDPAAGGLHITGEWQVVGADDDFLQINTRSSGNPAGQFDATQDGIEFIAFTETVEAPNLMAIVGNGAAAFGTTNYQEQNQLAIHAGVTYLFDVTDNGSALTFTLTRKDNPTETRTISTTSSYASSTNLVTFYNRETCCNGFHTSRLDNITISRITPPTPTQQIASITSTIQGLNLGNDGAQLLASLDAANSSLARGNTTAAKNQLNAFKNKVSAQRGKKLTAAQADALLAAADQVIASIG